MNKLGRQKASERLVDKEWPTRSIHESDGLMMSPCFMTHRSKRYVMLSMRIKYHTHSVCPFASPLFFKNATIDWRPSPASEDVIVFVQQTLRKKLNSPCFSTGLSRCVFLCYYAARRILDGKGVKQLCCQLQIKLRSLPNEAFINNQLLLISLAQFCVWTGS